MSLEQLAQVTGLSKGFLSRVERDATSPSAATLVAVCRVLDVTVGSLFEYPETNHIRRGDLPIVTLVGDLVAEHLLTPRRQRRLQLIHATIAPGGSAGADLFTVNCQVEVAYVQSGAIDIEFASKTASVSAGEALTFSGQEPHTWVNHGSEPAEVIWVMIPAPWSTIADGEM